MINAGITGGIGSGKTIVCNIFRALGIPVFHADQVGRALYDESHVRNQVLNRFGSGILDTNGSVNKKALAEIVFQDPESLAFLNSLIHPEVRLRYRQWLEDKSQYDYTLYEAAILMESGQYKNHDFNIVVVASEELRIRRVVSRDKVSAEEVRMRMANQWGDAERNALADFIICNDEDTALIPQVLKIHKEISGK